MRNALSLQLGE